MGCAGRGFRVCRVRLLGVLVPPCLRLRLITAAPTHPPTHLHEDLSPVEDALLAPLRLQLVLLALLDGHPHVTPLLEHLVGDGGLGVNLGGM